MIALNTLGTHYTKKGFPGVKVEVPADAPTQKVGKPYEGQDNKEYRVVYLREDQYPDVPRSWYLADEAGRLTYRIDVPIKRDFNVMDNGEPAGERFKAPQPQLFQIITEGVLGGKLNWGLILTGALIAVSMELMGISSLPVAVGMYLGLGVATPVFAGGLLRWLADRWRGVSASEAETETSPGVLLSSGYIAGGTLCGLLIGFFAMLPKGFNQALDLGQDLGTDYLESPAAKWVALATFAVLELILFWVGARKTPVESERIEDRG